jgi:hypothetical protein
MMNPAPVLIVMADWVKLTSLVAELEGCVSAVTIAERRTIRP